MEIRRFRRLQQKYGERVCPECDGILTLFVGDGDRLYECCHKPECSFENQVEEDEI